MWPKPFRLITLIVGTLIIWPFCWGKTFSQVMEDHGRSIYLHAIGFLVMVALVAMALDLGAPDP